LYKPSSFKFVDGFTIWMIQLYRTVINNVEFELTPDAEIPEHLKANHSLYSKVRQVHPTVAQKDTVASEEATVVLPNTKDLDPLHAAWSEFISRQPWQWFVTFTFKEQIHPESADKLWRVWLNKLNRDLYGQRWRKKPSGGVKWVRALEYQKRGVLHYHALIANVGCASSDKWASVWTTLGETSKAGFIKIDQYDESRGGAEAYLSKYVTKGGQVDISDNFQANIHFPDHGASSKQYETPLSGAITT